MKKTLAVISVLLIALLLFGCTGGGQQVQSSANAGVSEASPTALATVRPSISSQTSLELTSWSVGHTSVPQLLLNFTSSSLAKDSVLWFELKSPKEKSLPNEFYVGKGGEKSFEVSMELADVEETPDGGKYTLRVRGGEIASEKLMGKSNADAAQSDELVFEKEFVFQEPSISIEECTFKVGAMRALPGETEKKCVYGLSISVKNTGDLPAFVHNGNITIGDTVYDELRRINLGDEDWMLPGEEKTGTSTSSALEEEGISNGILLVCFYPFEEGNSVSIKLYAERHWSNLPIKVLGEKTCTRTE